MRGKYFILKMVASLSISMGFLSNTVFAGGYQSGTVWYTGVYMGNEFNGSGTYDDGLMSNYGYENNEFMQDALDDTKMIHSVVVEGEWGAGVTVTLGLWNIQTDSSGNVIGTPTEVGTQTVTPSEIGQRISLSQAVNAISIQATVTSSTSNGYFYLYKMFGDVTQYTPSGESIFNVPPFANTPVTTPVTSVSSAGVVNVYSVQTPPNWPVIEQGIADDIISEIPAIPDPPSGSDAISISSQLQISIPNSYPELSTPVITGIPDSPPETGAVSFDFSDSGDTSSIAVPTSDSKPFSIKDPLAGLTHSTGIPTPGDAPNTSMVPTTPQGNTPLPKNNPPDIGTAPSYSANTASLGILPSPAGSGIIPMPSGSSGTDSNTPEPVTNSSTSAPNYYKNGISGNADPMYNYNP
ncbi:hypothetical protein SAMN04489725_11612 [Alicyclobacillus hesperidum]|uniref:Uncharacterized protein n=1 Tax=Alicyclobacillus hesperidum TaxID=89784 RepID=A0A1H2WNS9_9BACL|nr:hypothetical protein [Alicyclobacillus hesperidum]SDW82148.1 hypothetical protein SAMN04489725_11612 [Alicyclobacillus hesperidum]